MFFTNYSKALTSVISWYSCFSWNGLEKGDKGMRIIFVSPTSLPYLLPIDHPNFPSTSFQPSSAIRNQNGGYAIRIWTFTCQLFALKLQGNSFFGLMSGLLSFPSSSYDPVKFNFSCIYGSYSVASGIQQSQKKVFSVWEFCQPSECASVKEWFRFIFKSISQEIFSWVLSIQ